MLFVVVCVSKAGIAQDFGFLFALGQAGDGELVQRNGEGQGEAVGFFGGIGFFGFGRRGFALEMHAACADFVDVQMPVPEFARLPAEIEAADFNIGRRGFHPQVACRKAAPDAAGNRVRRVDAGILRQPECGETQPAFRAGKPVCAACRCAEQQDDAAQRVFEQTAFLFGCGFFRRGGLVVGHGFGAA